MKNERQFSCGFHNRNKIMRTFTRFNAYSSHRLKEVYSIISTLTHRTHRGAVIFIPARIILHLMLLMINDWTQMNKMRCANTFCRQLKVSTPVLIKYWWRTSQNRLRYTSFARAARSKFEYYDSTEMGNMPYNHIRRGEADDKTDSKQVSKTLSRLVMPCHRAHWRTRPQALNYITNHNINMGTAINFTQQTQR